jgi:hypothetical protein
MKRASTSRSSLRALFVLVMCLGLGRPAPGQSPKATANRQAHTNRLIGEKSPYLLLHAHNPVDWYPWGEAAFAKARRENKPIFLSIGYYTCHWCHVMERESYSNPAIAALLNKWFVSVKVDREERPDVDRTYITFLEATSGGAGWPANIFLTPDLKPFFGGTYFPPRLPQPFLPLRSSSPSWRSCFSSPASRSSGPCHCKKSCRPFDHYSRSFPLSAGFDSCRQIVASFAAPWQIPP